MALTSSISKFHAGLGVFTLGLALLSCSSNTPLVSSDEDSIKLSEELNSLSAIVQVMNYGPTLKAGGSFIDRTVDYGLDNLVGVAFNAVDLNFDGFSDLVILPTYYSRPKFYIFDPALKKFSPWAHDPIPLDFKASYLLIYDVNKDRVMDLVVGVLNQRSEVSQMPVKLYLGSVKGGLLSFNLDPNFINLPAEATSSISLIDYDLDGWLDIFIGNWFENRKGQYLPTSDRLLKNNKGKFEDVSFLLRNETVRSADQLYPPNAKPTYGSSTCDIDQNGFPDILTVSSSGHKNKLWMNLKETQNDERFFTDLGPETNYASDPDGNLIPTGGGRSFFSACTDYNDDGIMDIFVGELSHAYDNDSVDKSSILTGSKEIFPPYFIRTEYVSDASSESWNQGDRRGVWMDYNLDGRIDLLVDNSGFPPYSRLVMFEQDETHGFMSVASQLGMDIVNPTGSISLDLNQDGYPDIITGQSNIRRSDITARLYVFENQAKVAGRKSVKVHLKGYKSNSMGLGAMVMLYTQRGDKKIVQRRTNEYTQGGLPSQNESGIVFGVSEGTEALGVKVRWPYLKKNGFGSGTVLEKLYSLKGLPVKDFLEVTVCEDGKILAGNTSCQF